MDILNEGHRKARKNHQCDGWRYVGEAIHDFPNVKICQGIKKGDEYYFQTNTYDGIGTFKSCKQCMEQAKIHDIEMMEY